MKDADCTTFLQWALPQLDMRWVGFRKVRGQVCKRLRRRMSDLGLEGFAAYRARLEADPHEWCILDECCHITISASSGTGVCSTHCVSVSCPRSPCARRGRDGRRAAGRRGVRPGEEPYTLKILWDLEVADGCPGVTLSIVATDIDEAMLRRARKGCFEVASLRELPPNLVVEAFDRSKTAFVCTPGNGRASRSCSGPTHGSTNRSLRFSALPLRRLHLFRAAAAREGPEPAPATAPTAWLSCDRDA